MFLKKLLFVITLYILILVFFQCTCLLYADRIQAFSSINAGLQYKLNTNRNSFHDFWKHDIGIKGFIETPFYFGCIQAGIQMDSFLRINYKVYDFQTVNLYVGWGKKWLLPYNFKCFTGFNIGNALMIFDEEKNQYEDQYNIEQELRTGIELYFSIPIQKKMDIYLTESYSVIYTYHRIRLNFISVGISYSFTTPKWFREFMK
ncbi:MAG: hypothetical protein KAU01_04500 [Candidatus Cloacimonetes bacterium]|nr:hypothetical protein [Candidatus Cloacimonadota bacterium]